MLSILIIEEDITFSLMLKTWLGKKGFVVESASLIQEAKRKIADTKFDLIISDLRLPDDDGIDLLKWLKEKGLSIPLIIMTGYAEIQTAVQAMKLGAADYIAKPLNPDELLGKIRELLGGDEKRPVLLSDSAEDRAEPHSISSRSNHVAHILSCADAAHAENKSLISDGLPYFPYAFNGTAENPAARSPALSAEAVVQDRDVRTFKRVAKRSCSVYRCNAVCPGLDE